MHCGRESLPTSQHTNRHYPQTTAKNIIICIQIQAKKKKSHTHPGLWDTQMSLIYIRVLEPLGPAEEMKTCMERSYRLYTFPFKHLSSCKPKTSHPNMSNLRKCSAVVAYTISANLHTNNIRH